MDEELYEIAKQNLKYKRTAFWFSLIGVVFSLGAFVWLIESNGGYWPWLVLVIGILALGFALIAERKIVSKKHDPILEEMNRLKKAGFTSDDVEELELKQIVKRYDNNDLV